MIIITGGAYQGKKAFAKKRFGIDDKDIASGKEIFDAEALSGYRAVSDYEYVIRHNLEAGRDAKEEFEKLASLNNHIIIIASEVGSGIIPINESDNRFREEAGRIMCLASDMSEAGYRVVCGVGVQIK